MDSVERRLLKLERTNRVWRYLCTALALGFIAAFTLAPAPALPPVIRAKGFELVTPSGQRAFFGPSDNGKAVGLFLCDAHSRVRSVLEVTADGPSQLRFIGADGGEISEFGFTNQWAGLSFGKPADSHRVFLGRTVNGKAMLLMHGPDGETRVGLWIADDGGYLRLDDTKGNRRFSVPASTQPTSQPDPIGR
jgi:hypothetical protein